MGVSISDVFNTLQVCLGSLYVNDFNRFGRTWQVNVQADANYRKQIEDIKQLKVRNDRGSMVPLGSLSSVRAISGPVMIVRYNMYPAAADQRQSPRRASARARPSSRWTTPPRPTLLPGMQTRMDRAGPAATADRQHGHARLSAGRGAGVPRAGRAIRKLVAAAGRDPGGAHVPAVLHRRRGAGTAWTSTSSRRWASWCWSAWPARTRSSSSNSPRCRREAGQSRREATLAACKLRLRPIIMTSFAFIIGVIPLAISQGAGAEMRRTLGTAVFSGMLGVTLFGIFLTPVFYYVIQWMSELRAARRSR